MLLPQLSQVSVLSRHDGNMLHGPSFHISSHQLSFSPSRQPTFIPPMASPTAHHLEVQQLGLWGSISTLQYPGCCRATMILLTLSWRTNIARNVFHSVKNEQDRYNFERWEKTDGLLPGNAAFFSPCYWPNCSVKGIINGLDLSVFPIHTAACKMLPQPDFK